MLRKKITKIIIFSNIFLIGIIQVGAAPADQNNNVGVDAYVPCELTILTRPEKRVLSPNPDVKDDNPNRATDLRIDIYDGTSFITRFTGLSNNLGEVVFDPCDPNYEFQSTALGGDSYNIYVKGLSHLRRSYQRTIVLSSFAAQINLVQDDSDLNLQDRLTLLNSFKTIVEYEGYIEDLYAGEVSVNFDNLINALDFSVFSSDYRTDTNLTDLNQDGIVNSLDFSIMSTNFWKGGDLLPGETWSNSAQNYMNARENLISNQ